MGVEGEHLWLRLPAGRQGGGHQSLCCNASKRSNRPPSMTHEAASISSTSSNISHPTFSNHSTAASTDQRRVLTRSHRISPGMNSRPLAPSSANRSASCSRFLPLPMPSSEEATFSGSAICRPSLVATLRRRFSRSFSLSRLQGRQSQSDRLQRHRSTACRRAGQAGAKLRDESGRLTPACTSRASSEPCAPSATTSRAWRTTSRAPSRSPSSRASASSSAASATSERP